MSEPSTGVSGLVLYPGREVHVVLVLLEKEAQLAKFLPGVAGCSELGVEVLDLWTTRGGFALALLASVAPTREGGVEAFVDCLGKLDGVRAVDSTRGFAGGLAVESWGFPVLPGTSRTLVLEAGLFSSMLRESWKLLGKAFQLPLYNSTFSYGRDLARRLRGLGLDEKSFLYAASEVIRHLGLGRVFWETVTDTRVAVTVYDSLECSAMVGVPGYESSILRGLVAGVVAELWGADRSQVDARETSCVARGDRACRIEVLSRQK
ncbi:hypothetical protein IG193_08985 [Infirmifilum lucidum]|uniref:4-vinyl reductase 4VR domain-containing protein n=1 Tax=Infirmifilum lucidum TaxID=2776706 RepID=A0A7L9FGV6_9CREN|nr:4-vinyl reductase [Infirmifilum lucidum]QOJ78861.1 hypothetical protein IG193_08985 [Infirmifilum lucidum]